MGYLIAFMIGGVFGFCAACIVMAAGGDGDA